MKWIDNVEFMDRVIGLIKRRSTGDSVSFAKKLDMSERNLHRLISDMRSAGFPINYCTQNRTYCFSDDVKYEFTLKIGDEDLIRIKGGSRYYSELFGFDDI